MYLFAAITFMIGAVLPTSALSSDMQSLLITFFGLLSAGLIPAITLLLTAQVPSNYTVAHLEKLEAETDALVEGLISTLVIILIGGIATLIANVGLPIVRVQTAYPTLDKLIEFAPQRFMQAFVFTCFVIGLDRLRIFAAALRTTRALRRDLALGEARRRLNESAPTADEVKVLFKRSATFGAKVTVLRQEQEEGDG